MKRTIRIINPDQACQWYAQIHGTTRPCEAGTDGHPENHRIALSAEDTDGPTLEILWLRRAR